LGYDRAVGHREQLIEGAKRCLAEKGYQRTTARDIVAASGTNLASIGYHFGSKDALLTQAMIETLGEWGDEVGRVLAQAADASPMNRLEAMWKAIIESFQSQRGVWTASFEVGIIAEQQPELRAHLAKANQLARVGLAAIFLDRPEDEIDEDTAHTVGSFLLAVIPGLFSQWMMDPGSSPGGRSMAEGLRRIVDTVRRSEAPQGEARASAASRD
jgi:AcrR family transcriptional regulator